MTAAGIWPIRRSYDQPELRLGRDTLRWGTRTFVMGIINTTADSFSGDGIDADADEAVKIAEAHVRAGADLIDVGGESTRPGADRVEARRQLTTVVPAVRAITDALPTPVSVDTSLASVADAALVAGAAMINDTRGLLDDPELAAVVAAHGCGVVLMHNQRGRPHTDVVDDVKAGFDEGLTVAADAGIDPGRIVLDPGFGFGWSAEQNLELLRRLPELWGYAMPLLVGTSRKSTIGAVLGSDVDHRRFGTAATVAHAISAGVDIARVHDVAEMVDVARMTDAIVR